MGGVLALLMFIQGAVDRLWFMHTIVLNSDEAIDALEANALLHGHFSAMFWGANYGGTQPYVTAAFFAVLPRNGYTLRLSTIVISFIGTYFIWKIARKSLEGRLMAASVTAIAFVFPVATIYQLTYAYGFRVVTYSCLFAMIYVAILISEGYESGRYLILLGLLAGLGWWSNPEIIYGVVPVAILIVPSLQHLRQWSRRVSFVATIVLGFLIGSIPWWWVSARSHFQTLHFQGVPSTIGQRLSVYVHWVLPTQFGLRQYGSGNPLVFPSQHALFLLFYAVAVVILVACTISALWVPGVRRAIGAATAASPVIYVLSPATTYWQDGRYAIYFVALFALTGAIGLERLTGWMRARKILWNEAFERCVVIAVLLMVLLWSSAQINTWSAFQSDVHWSDAAQADAISTSAALEQAGFTTGWADYWTAYLLDYESGGAVALSPTPNDVPRDVSLATKVLAAPATVWLVTGPPDATGSGPAPTDTAPGGLTYQQLTQGFASLGVTWRVQIAGNVWVVIPSRLVTPAELGL